MRKRLDPIADNPAPVPRDERKSRTRRALLDAALGLLEGERSFSSISLREVAKAAGVVPAAFYRHFASMEDLGQALVDDSFSALHQVMRSARAAPLPASNLIANSVQTFLRHALDQRLHFQFIAKERVSGSSAVRLAIRKEIRLWTSELATDLAPFPNLRSFSGDDLRMLAGLVVNAMMAATELILDADTQDAGELKRIHDNTQKQLLLIFLGAANWKSRPAKG
jgi:AcrR family transcriptional regulator